MTMMKLKRHRENGAFLQAVNDRPYIVVRKGSIEYVGATIGRPLK